ncbi:DUF6111 family protein [Methylocystis bryophila]|uniref:Uncharacterized protein n=1 Tax=Methylocystis bryophila TaxID=655015 RepID=A0A1W6MZQ2_9HYPH|nr:DUF6111 family protein [Methylocystis bryophila]ARN83048.1 hypothetical protein B1812_20360 [Methylocystis bryophila]BDV39351.1 hypothetical protein DSM21852_26040 [Methylocystis bryophila]
MWRAFLETAFLFALPFILYAAFHLLFLRWPFVASLWTPGRISSLAIAGLALAVIGMLALGVLGPRERGAYVPAHIENGRLAPGRFE